MERKKKSIKSQIQALKNPKSKSPCTPGWDIYGHKVYKVENFKLTEVKDFDFSDIEVKGEHEEIEYYYLPFLETDMKNDVSMLKFILELLHILCKYTIVRLISSSKYSKEKEITNILKKYNQKMEKTGDKDKLIDIERIEYFHAEFEEVWLRDSFPTFAQKKSTGETILIKMYFDGWGTTGSIINHTDKIDKGDTSRITNIRRDLMEMESDLKWMVKENKELLKLYSQFPEVDYIIECNYIHDGGARIFNGNGTMMLNEHYERVRNSCVSSEFSIKKTEELFSKIFGVKNFIWLKYPPLAEDWQYWYDIEERLEKEFEDKLKKKHGKEILRDEDYDDYEEEEEDEEDKNKLKEAICYTEGHVDAFAVFADEKTIVYCDFENKVDNEDDKENTRRLKANLECLKNAKDIDGNKFNLIPLPKEIEIFKMVDHKDKIIQENYILSGQRLAKLKKQKQVELQRVCNYVNYIVVNKAVICSKIYKEGMSEEIKKSDDECYEIFKKVFPDREIFMIDTEAINWGDGSLHCITAHQSK